MQSHNIVGASETDMRVNACPGGLVTDLRALGHVPAPRDS